ncbi:hypothetical protein GSbR_33870 [Geobacter sp. SVR]|nr:hypothetical protein GSVR_10250 [Geobacter sp. SVR]GCF86787.1 hypothetical protein GSbR_33870 [Geobacter sp. SVR]
MRTQDIHHVDGKGKDAKLKSHARMMGFTEREQAISETKQYGSPGNNGTYPSTKKPSRREWLGGLFL